MKEETKSVFRIAMFFICGAGLIASCERQPAAAGEQAAVAKIRFSQAKLEANGALKVDYEYTTSSDTLLVREKDFVNGTKSGESAGSAGNSLDSQSSTKTSYHITLRDIPSPPPPMLVTTGQTYYLKLNDHLPIYNFTNNAEQTYRSELSLELFSHK